MAHFTPDILAAAPNTIGALSAPAAQREKTHTQQHWVICASHAGTGQAGEGDYSRNCLLGKAEHCVSYRAQYRILLQITAFPRLSTVPTALEQRQDAGKPLEISCGSNLPQVALVVCIGCTL